MDGFTIDSEPPWDRAELDVMASFESVDITGAMSYQDTLGYAALIWLSIRFAQQPWSGPDRREVTNRVIVRRDIEADAPPYRVCEAVALCKAQGLLVGLPRHRRCICWKKSAHHVWNLARQF